MASISRHNHRHIRQQSGYVQARLRSPASAPQPSMRQRETGNDIPTLGSMTRIAGVMRVGATRHLREITERAA